MTVSFTISASDAQTVGKIVARAVDLGITNDRMSTHMDLVATHANGCPMDFGRLLGADNFNLAHDVCGIARHLDRDTGKLGGCFLPRFAAKAEAIAA